MNEEIMIKRMQKDDDSNKVAQLIYETAVDLFKALFGSRQTAIPRIETLVKLENNIFSYKNTLVAKKGEEINGILIGYDAASVDREEMKKDIRKAMPFFARLRFWGALCFSNHIMDLDGITGYYIQNICVDAANRGKRIGGSLLEYCIAKNAQNGTDNLYLDVESTNKAALNLYTAMGFEIFRKTNIKIAGVTLYRMRRAIR